MSKVLNFNNHPDFESVKKIYQVLKQNNFQVYLAGGCVRDGLLNVETRDFDIATNALPEQVEALFPVTKPIGKAFGVILVIENSVEVEVTTFRADGGYQDGRRPDSVQFIKSGNQAKEDAVRRDFTVNAMFYDLEKSEVVDFVGGLQDLKNKKIRAVGDAEKRFAEDHLRILRAVRFIGQLGFELEAETRKAILKLASTVTTVSGERLHSELGKLLESQNVNVAAEELKKTGLTEVLFGKIDKALSMPDFTKTKSLNQRWGLFYIWLNRQLATLNIEQSLDKLKFSNLEKTAIKKILYWFKNPKGFEDKSLGELIELSFDEDSYFGMQEFADDKHTERLNKIKTRHDYYRGVRPAPDVSAQKLKDQGLIGPDLGNRLRELYWKQLEG